MKARTLRGDRLHIGFFGRRNAGKSSLVNAVTGQAVAIVSDVPGTTTDPVYKAMEMLPLGPVVLIDTAGLDDISDILGEERKRHAGRVLSRTDLALLVVDARGDDFAFEEELLSRLEKEKIPVIIVVNKIDLEMGEAARRWLTGRVFVRASAVTGRGIDELKRRIKELAPREWEPPFVRDLVHPEEVVVLVTPIDLGAPRGRLIMPQVKALRDILDGDAIPVMCKERELRSTLAALREPPALVVTDSQVFPQVAADLPPTVHLTSFSILSIRQKGELGQMVKGVAAVSGLRPGDRVLIAEACTHHPLEDDIGRIKIPRWLNHHVGGELKIDTVPGFDYPDDLEKYSLVVHCGGCTLNRREMLRRQRIAAEHGVPVTNYGVLIAFLKSVFPRALEPFPEFARLFSAGGEEVDRDMARRMAGFTEI
ncbi:MAG: [FeFe] hydrogenase H-cluster maturation GTPase HydF [Candidatus Aminicenantes bacterium]|nr:[FeFe] hydrogenase H-cluster maturation GTPase HydF [Candidatus Aminicenantes bacterium]